MYNEVVNENVFVDLLKTKIITLESVNVIDKSTKVVNESKDAIVHKSSDCGGSQRNFLGEFKDTSP